MSTNARLTMIGMYNYDPSIFDMLSLPEGYDRDTFINSFLLEHGEKCVLYTDPNFMKFSIGVVSQKWRLELQRILEALTTEYTPIYNYDRYEEFEDHGRRDSGTTTTANYNEDRTLNTQNKRTANLEDKRTANLQDKTTHDTTQTTEQVDIATSEKKVAAYNSSTYQPTDKTEDDLGKVTVDIDGTDTIDTTGTDTMNHTGTDTIDNTGTDKLNISGTMSDVKFGEGTTNTHTAHLYGNIGVTTATQMTNEVLNQRLKSNLYSTAAGIFANELLIQVY